MQITIDTSNATALELRQAAGLLLAIAEGVAPVGANLSGAVPIGSLSQADRSQALSTIVRNLADAGKLAPADNPAAGIPSATEAFPGNGLPGVATPPPTPEQAFSVPVSAPSLPPAPAPAPAAPTVAPGAPTVPGPAAASGVTLDKRGLPWDGRIHAKAEGGGGVITKEGIWRAKRGLNDGALVARIEAELLQALAAPKPAAVVPPPPPFVPGANAPVFPEGVPPAPAPAPAPVAPPAPTEGPTTLPALMALCAPKVNKGQLTMEQIIGAAAELGVPSIPALASRPDVIPQVWAKLAGMLAAWGL